jgi:tellurium resistance protein TerD
LQRAVQVRRQHSSDGTSSSSTRSSANCLGGSADRLLGDDDEQIEVDLASVPADIDRIVAVLYINEGSASKRALGQLQSCVIRVLNLADNVELVRSEDLAQALNAETSVILGQLYRHQGGWKFKVVGQGSSAGLRGIAQAHGLKL